MELEKIEELIKVEDNELVLAEDVINYFGELAVQKAKIEMAEAEFRRVLAEQMSKYGVTQYCNEDTGLTISYKNSFERKTLDSTLIRHKYPQIADECTKVSTVKPTVVVTWK